MIRTYKSDIVVTPLVKDQLWAIMDLDEKWEAISDSRNKLQRQAALLADPNKVPFDEEKAAAAQAKLPAKQSEYEAAKVQAKEAREELEQLGPEPEAPPPVAEDAEAEMELEEDGKTEVRSAARRARRSGASIQRVVVWPTLRSCALHAPPTPRPHQPPPLWP